MTQWERDFEVEARKLGQAEMDRRLRELPAENGRPKSCPRCGKQARVRARAVERTFTSMWGTHTFRRDYHYCESCKAGFYPRDEFLGLPREGALTEEVESRLVDFAVNDSYEQAQVRWQFHYRHLRVSSNQFRQAAKRLGQQVDETDEALLQAALKPPPAQAPDRLYVLADGGMVPMRGIDAWREVKVGVVFRDEHHTHGDAAVRGCVSEARYSAVLGNQETFKEHMRAALQVEGSNAAAEVVWLADGAPPNWSLASMLCPNAVQVLDWYHAMEHAADCGKAVLGEGAIGLSHWCDRAAQLLLGGNFEALLAELRDCQSLAENDTERTAVGDLIEYYEVNRRRMDYASYRARGLLVGSGIVESAHRHVIQARMKKAGQHWGERGGRQMARIRAAYRTSGPDRFYASIAWAHRQTLRIRPLRPARHKVDLRRRGMPNR
jgi:hypothetical protein